MLKNNNNNITLLYQDETSTRKKTRVFLLVFDVRRIESSSFVHGVDHGVVIVVVALGVDQDALSTPVRRRSTTFIVIIIIIIIIVF